MAAGVASRFTALSGAAEVDPLAEFSSRQLRHSSYALQVANEVGQVEEDHTRETLERRGLQLEYATIAWNAVEMVIAIGLGLAARSLALVAFGLDTMVELFASGVVVWHLRHPGRDSDRITALALRLVGWAFFVLATVVTVGAIWALVTEATPAGVFYVAEDVHQEYYRKRNCHPVKKSYALELPM